MANKINVYTIDDEILFLLDLKTSIQNGIKVIGFNSSPEDALIQIEAMNNMIDVIICDINLGEGAIDGIELLKRVHEKYPIPVIFISGHSDLINDLKAQNKKLYDGLIKPFYYSELISKINRIYELNHP